MFFYSAFTVFCGLIFCCVSTFKLSSKVIPKCCYKGEILDSDAKKCINKNGLLNPYHISEHFEPPISNNTIFWLPDSLRNSKITVTYGHKHVRHYNLIRTIPFHSELNLKLLYNTSQSLIFPVKQSWICFDETDVPHRRRVILNGVLLETIHKCCGAHEVLSPTADACENVSEYSVNDTWIPKSLRSPNNSPFQTNFMVNFMILGYKFDELFIVKDDLRVNFIPGDTISTTIHFRGFNASGVLSEGTTDLFCFDLLQEGNITSQVLLTAVYHLNKCGAKGKRLSSRVVSEYLSDVRMKDVKNEIIDWKDDKILYDWVPKAFHQKAISVQYYYILKIIPNFIPDTVLWRYRMKPVIFNEKMWSFNFRNDSLPTVSANIRFLSGRRLNIMDKQWCLEQYRHTNFILVRKIPNLSSFIRKCCEPGHVLSPEGYCEKHDGEDWSPKASTVRELFKDDDIIPEENIGMPLISICPHQPYGIYSLHSSTALLYYQNKHPTGVIQKYIWHCIDYQRMADGIKEVVGSCTDPVNAVAYAVVRPMFGLAAAILLVAAAAVALARADTRRSAHGRALVCHALCLAAASILQVASFFLGDWRSKSCIYFAYTIYFLMVAANCWLTAITFNMVKNFRKPLGALARVATSRSVWRRFGAMSACAWGVSIGYTAFVVTMHLHRKFLIDQGIATPTFSETRSCSLEIENTIKRHIGADLPWYGHQNGALFYYFIPMLLLVTINTVSVVLTMRRIRHLGKDSAFVQRGGSANTALSTVLPYVKLMLTSGFVELILEVTSWSSQSNKVSSSVGRSFLDRAFAFRMIASGVDLVRASCVLWLCLGNWCNMGTLWSRTLTGLRALSRMAMESMNRCRKHLMKNGTKMTSSDIPMKSFLNDPQEDTQL